METESLSSHQPTFGIKLVFILFGIASLLGCNALLTELSFFDHFLHSMNPFVSFPFLNYFLNVVFQILIFAKKDLFPLKFQLIGGLVGSIFFLVVIPLFTIILEKDSSINKIVTGAFIVLMGFINALCNAGFYGLVSFFPMELIVSLSTGQGLSGISMALIQYIVLLTIESDGKDDKPIIIQGLVFFISSIIILLISLVILLISYNKEFFQYYLNKKDDKPGASSEIEMNESLGSIDERVNSSDKIQTKGELTFGQIFRKIWSFDLLVFLNYIVTFAVYPGASINQKLFSLTGAFNSNTVIMIYNVFDTLGRMLVSKMKPTKQLNMIIILARTVLLFTIVFNYYCQDKLDWNIVTTSILLIINVSILAATNGIATTLCFGLAPNEVENEYKGQAGSSVSLFLIVGIVGGSSLAFLVDLIIGTFKKQPVTE
jgi:hypothetical protein